MEEGRTVGRLYSLDDAARQLGISVWTLRSHQKRGSLRVTRVGRRVLVSVMEIQRIEMGGLPTLGHSRKPDSDGTIGLPREKTEAAGPS